MSSKGTTRMECLNEDSAKRFADRLIMAGYEGVKISQKLADRFGRWFVYFKKKPWD